MLWPRVNDLEKAFKMDYSGNGDYDVNTPFKFEGDDQDQPSGGVEDSR